MKNKLRLSALFAALALAAGTAQAATYNWLPDVAGPTPWDDLSSWDVGSGWPNAQDDIANLTNDITANSAISIGTAVTVGTLNIGDAAGNNYFIIDPASTLTFDASSGPATLTRTATGSGLDAINTSVTLNTNLTITVNSVNGQLTVGGNINESGGSRSLTKDGAGRLDLTGTNSHSGGVIINAGVMQSLTASALGTGANLTFSGPGTVVPAYDSLQIGRTIAQSVIVNPGVTATFDAANQFYRFIFTNPVSGDATTTIRAIGSDNGAGFTTFSNVANSFTGAIEIGDASFGSTLTVNSLADSLSPIKFYGTSARPAYLILGAGTASPVVFSSRQVQLLGGSGASAVIRNSNTNVANTITINTSLDVGASVNRTLTLGGVNTGDNTFAGVIADGTSALISLSKVDAGKWILSGVNTYTSNTTVSAGTLVLASTGQLKFAITDTTANSLSRTGGSVILDGSFNIDTSATTGGAVGPWTLVSGSVTYGGTFSVASFTNMGGGVWLRTIGSQNWVFRQSTGQLSLAPAATFLTFGIPGYDGVINNVAKTVALTVPYTPWGISGLATLAPTFALSSGTCDQTSGAAPSPTFAAANPATYTLIDSGASVTNPYVVTVSITPASTAKAMFNIQAPGPVNAIATDYTGTNFLLVVPPAANVSALPVTYSVSPWASGSPASGTAQNFTTPQTYIVTAEDGSQQAYRVTVQQTTALAGYQNIVLASGPVSYWPLDETSGTTAFDRASGLNNLTYGGTLTLNETGLRPDGKPCVLFANTTASAYTGVSNNPCTLNPSQFSIECWVKPTNAVVQYLVSLQDRVNYGGGAGRRGYALWKNNTTGFGMQWGTNATSGTDNFNGPTLAIAGNVYHVVGTYDGATMRLYVNGVLDASKAAPLYMPAGTNQPGFSIASRNGINPAPSYMQDVAIYNRALTLQEIQTHYNSRPTLSITQSGTDVVLSWVPSGGGTLQTNSVVNGSYNDVSGATSPTTNTASPGNLFYRLKF